MKQVAWKLGIITLTTITVIMINVLIKIVMTMVTKPTSWQIVESLVGELVDLVDHLGKVLVELLNLGGKNNVLKWKVFGILYFRNFSHIHEVLEGRYLVIWNLSLPFQPLLIFSSYKPKKFTITITIIITIAIAIAIIIITNVKDTDLPFPVAIWSWQEVPESQEEKVWLKPSGPAWQMKMDVLMMMVSLEDEDGDSDDDDDGQSRR